jgi:DNA-binding NarL/FixJ family response regulator
MEIKKTLPTVQCSTSETNFYVPQFETASISILGPKTGSLGQSYGVYGYEFGSSTQKDSPTKNILVRMRSNRPFGNVLTSRQQEIFMCLVRNLQHKQISKELGISVYTVNNHVKTILDLCEVPTTEQAIYKGFMEGELTPEEMRVTVDSTRINLLTPRELSMLERITDPYGPNSTIELAEAFDRAENTIKQHLQNISFKLDTRSRTQAGVIYLLALERGILERSFRPQLTPAEGRALELQSLGYHKPQITQFLLDEQLPMDDDSDWNCSLKQKFDRITSAGVVFRALRLGVLPRISIADEELGDLTEGERAVLKYMTSNDGVRFSNTKLSAGLKLPENEINDTMSKICDKLDVGNKMQAAVKYFSSLLNKAAQRQYGGMSHT